MVKGLLAVFILFFTLFLFADREAVVYTDVPTAEQREDSVIYQPFPNFKIIELVKEGHLVDQWSSLINVQLWPEGFAEGVKLEDFETLQVSDFDIIPENILLQEKRVSVPFTLTIRAEKKGLLKGAFDQTTLNADGIIEIQVSEEGEFFVKMVRFDDSNDYEEAGRELGVISHYDGDFVNMISVPVITQFFTQSDNQRRLVDMIQANFFRY